MDEKMIEDLKIQHINNYRLAIIETIKNNTRSLVDDDITSLIEQPPLDSMDVVKNKLLDLARKNKIVLKMDSLSDLLLAYRKSV